MILPARSDFISFAEAPSELTGVVATATSLISMLNFISNL